MRHYEIVFMIHPDKSEKSNIIITNYKNIIKKFSGKIHRLEDWGKRHLSYPIKKLKKAHYILMNIEISQKNIKKLENLFKFDDSIIRNIIISTKKAVLEVSAILKENNMELNKKESMVIKKIN
ncbi:30S ribosomal protein S6 [Buchnera aphidicola]|uniref:30S ribosomal protein S6 n=1 Tax=Buchnera aphidicola TaxID=9 RepID=UPI002237CB12|nr:30S ribosomal protein S6 [Buchnera aphidicola]MCW5197449.1 30S ribosomal protein S6 [Buchnera aphidicola (Chaitophorus viminalis)]